jgi:hypothetical protein
MSIRWATRGSRSKHTASLANWDQLAAVASLMVGIHQAAHGRMRG